MNAFFATPITPATISLACPWCDEPIAVDDAFVGTALRCGSCATSVDLEPVSAGSSARSMEIAA